VAGFYGALSVYAMGDLTREQVHTIVRMLGLVETPRTEGPGADASIAHRDQPHDGQRRLVLDLSCIGGDGWLMTVFFEGEPPSDELLEPYRKQMLSLVRELNLKIIKVDPPRTAEEVYLPPVPVGLVVEWPAGAYWDLPCQTLDHLFWHFGLREDAPFEVRRIHLEHMMRQPIWRHAPAELRREAEEFLATEGRPAP